MLIKPLFSDNDIFSCPPQLRISRYDGKPLSPLDLNHSAVVEVTQKTSFLNADRITLTLPVPKDGNMLIQFKLDAQAEMLLLEVSILNQLVGLNLPGQKGFSWFVSSEKGRFQGSPM